ncbi:MAG TPA: hypothetical protein VFG14_16280 [Chthoniobacteraceae bacterium]|nr:hypothetical protein [Chthoniobacteraceae bacterium]
MRRLTYLAIGSLCLGLLVPAALLRAQTDSKPVAAPAVEPTLPPPVIPADKSAPVEPAPALIPPGITPAPAAGTGPATSVLPPSGPAEVIADSWGLGPSTSLRSSLRTGKRPLPTNKIDQPISEANSKSVGCKDCHSTTDAHTMHASKAVVLGCTDCHGGDSRRGLTKEQAHVAPSHP